MKRFLITAATITIMAGLPHVANASENSLHWGYGHLDGPETWDSLSPEYAACRQGRTQSPIDLQHTNVAGDIEIKKSYKPASLNVTNTKNSLQVSVDNTSFISVQGKISFLKQLHFHTPSEHTKDGIPFPMEAHYVHQAKTGEFSIIAVLFTVGKSNPNLDDIINLAPQQADVSLSSEEKFNPEALLPDQLRPYRYMGSLATPPCTEGVNWFVLKDTSEASLQQIESLKAIMGNNARPVQPVYNRLVLEPVF